MAVFYIFKSDSQSRLTSGFSWKITSEPIFHKLLNITLDFGHCTLWILNSSEVIFKESGNIPGNALDWLAASGNLLP